MEKFKNKFVQAHRGARGLVKYENTIEAFEKAIEVGAESAELDVRKTKDNIIIVRHDGDYKGVKICDWNYEELKQETLKEGFYMPTLDEVVCKFGHRILLDVEIKEVGYEKDILDIIFKYLNTDQFYVRSFYDKAIRNVKKVNKKVKAALLLGTSKAKHNIFYRMMEIFPLFRLLYTKCDFVSPHYLALRYGFRFRMRLMRKPVFVWTVNDKELMKKLYFEKKVDGIVTDYPNLAIEVLKENGVR